MMKLAYIKKMTAVFAFCMIVTVSAIAQEKNDAIALFNQGVEQMKASDPKAVATFEQCVVVCEQIGDSAADIKAKAIGVIPDLYYKKAFNTLTVDKKIPEAVVDIKKAASVAVKYNDTAVKENTDKLLVQAYTNMASGYVAAKDNAKAIAAFDSVLMINPNHMPSIYNKALLYRGMDNSGKFMESIDLYISKLKETGDTGKIGQANKIARDYFRIAGGKSNQANKLSEALTSLNNALKYGSDNNVHYQLASVYNKQKKFALAAENAQKGLDLEPQTTPEARAKYYYELGTAQAGLGKTGDACTSLKNAMYGPFLNAAKAQRTNMKCQ